MKQIIAGLATFLFAAAAFGTSIHHAVTFSGVYIDGNGSSYTAQPFNNALLLKNNNITPADYHLYDVAINDDTGEIDIILRTGGVAQVVLAGTVGLAGDANPANTVQLVAAGVEFFGISNFVGTAYSAIRYNAAHVYVSDAINFIVACPTQNQIIRGSCVTLARKYTF